MNENKKVLTEEEKMKLSHLLAAIVPNGTLSPEDILWLMNEVENGNRNVSFDDFMKAKQERDNHKTCETCKYYDIPFNVDNIDNVVPCRSCIMHSKWTAKKSERVHLCLDCKHCACKADEEPCKSCSDYPHPGYLAMDSKWEPIEADVVHRCVECKHQTCKGNEEPCKSCCEWTHPGSSTMDSKWEPKEVEDTHLCKDCKFAENPIFKEPCHSCFKISNSGDDLYHTNWQPKDKEEEEKDIPEKVQDAVFPEFERIFTALESLDNVLLGMKVDIDRQFERTKSALDHIQERFEEYEKQQKDILEKLNNIEQVAMKNSVGINTTYEKASAVHDEVCKDEDICKDCNYYGMCSGYKGDMIYCKDFKKKDISSAKEPPKFKVGDIVKMTDDPKQNDFFVCRIKRSEHFERWNYLISLDLEDISGAFWRVEDSLIKSEDHSEPLFKVGDKVKLKAGKTVYTVLSVTHFICGERIVYRYRISHSATTPHYENENRLIKA